MSYPTLQSLLLAALLSGAAADLMGEENVRGSYLIDPRASYQTPKYLGVCLEVTEDAEQSNLWDWLAYSGAQMVRLAHPDKDMRLNLESVTACKAIATKDEFEAFRKRLLADPERNIPWASYRFEQRIPWLGVPDQQVRKTIEVGVMPIISIAYGPHYYPGALLKAFTGEIPAKDENVNWAAAASAYQYHLAIIYRYASRHKVTHYMMLNEPDGDAKYAQQLGVVARMGRLALEDVRSRLRDKTTADGLRFSGPACHFPWEEFWPHVAPFVDFLDLHFYDPDPEMFTRQYARAAARARESGKKVAFTEFNRIGGAMHTDEALWNIRPSLELGALTMGVLSAGRVGDPGCELALLYQFQSPATHRSFKSLVYGDMNVLDWSGRDQPLNMAPSECFPTAAELQLRFATPAYHVFRMLSRCTPGLSGKAESYEVLSVGESAKGFGHVPDPNRRHNVFKMLDETKFYALGGVGPDLRTLVVRAPDRLYINALNPGPNPAKRVGFDLDLIKESYATAVVRVSSLHLRDQAVAQFPVSSKRVIVDLPAESLTQVILLKEDLSKISELKLEELTATPGTLRDLGFLQTTRLRALGRLGDRWLDLSDLNVVWSSSAQQLVAVHQGGLVQRVRRTAKEIALTAKAVAGNLESSVTVAPSKEDRTLAPAGPSFVNGGFEEPAGVSQEQTFDWGYTQDIRWQMGVSPAKGWVMKGGSDQWERSLERNHTPSGTASLKLKVRKAAAPNLVLTSYSRDGIELYSRRYKVSAWLYRPSAGGLAEGKLKWVMGFNDGAKPVELEIANLTQTPLDQWIKCEQTVHVPGAASMLNVQLAFEAAGKPEGSLYIDDVALQAE